MSKSPSRSDSNIVESLEQMKIQYYNMYSQALPLKAKLVYLHSVTYADDAAYITKY
jgi:hypothetical protein